ncbi:MAG: flagellar basal body rod protein FlgB [Planctomycetales bacterium]|nr:flagellar basal body rod protein FlgB [Planctomycetales bacterium]
MVCFPAIFGNPKRNLGQARIVVFVVVILQVSQFGVDTTDMNITNGNFGLLARLMDASAIRQEVIAANIANVNTPGFKRKEVTFEQQLAQLLESDTDVSDSDLRPTIITSTGMSEREDGNSVDIDLEVGALSKNSVLFETYAQLMATKIGMMRSAISGRS